MYYVVDISEFIFSVTNCSFHYVSVIILILIKEMFSINITYLAVSHDYHFLMSQPEVQSFLVAVYPVTRLMLIMMLQLLFILLLLH